MNSNMLIPDDKEIDLRFHILLLDNLEVATKAFARTGKEEYKDAIEHFTNLLEKQPKV